MSNHAQLIEQLNILDIITQDVSLKKAANTNGGEYAGPCPFCDDGEDRFRVWPNHPTGRGQYWCRQCERSGDAIKYLRDRDGLSFQEALEALTGTRVTQRSRPKRPTPPEPEDGFSKEVARYTYTDEYHDPLFQVRRIHLYDEAGERIKKKFIQYRHSAEGWLPGLEETRRVIYRLPEIQAAIERDEVIFMVEGEKCADTLTAAGLEATTVPMGANAWSADYISSFVGARVVILPDNDEPGINHARSIAEDLFPHTEWVVLCDLPDLHPGEDVHDWLDAGNTVHDLFDYISTLEAWRPVPAFEPGQYLGDGVPDLSEAVPPPPQDDTGQFINDYIAYADKIAPMSPPSFHESAALWMASTVIARRYAVEMDYGVIYPNLYIAWVAETTMWTKSTALNIAKDVIMEVAPHLLAPEETTHEAMLSDMAGYRPANLRHDDPDMAEEYDTWKRERNFSGQRSVLLDEMSGILASAGKDYNAGLLEAFMRFYDCEKLYRRSTRAQGRLTIRNAYMSFIGASTPAALSRHFNADELWHNGWWPRFAVITPEEDYPEWKDSVRNQRNPRYIVEKMKDIYERLPEPEWPQAPETEIVPVSESALHMWKTYSRAMRHTALVGSKEGHTEIDERLFGVYGRLPTMALKVATLIAVMDWDPDNGLLRVESNHMARALNIVDRWRKSIHRLLKKITRTTYDKKRVRILRQLGRFGSKGATHRDLCQNMRDMTPNAIHGVVEQMMTAGDIFSYTHKPLRGGRPSVKYLPLTMLNATVERESTVDITLPPILNEEEDALLTITLDDTNRAEVLAETIPPPPTEQEADPPEAADADEGEGTDELEDALTPPKPLHAMNARERIQWRRKVRRRRSKPTHAGD